MLEDYGDVVWVEGVGHPGGPFCIWGLEVNDGSVHRLLSCYEGVQCIFTQDDFYGSITASVNSATNQMKSIGGAIYDLQGRRLRSQPTKGLYIQNGRKIFVR